MIRIGLISDTHGLLRPEALAALRGSEHIIHAGDIGDPAILAELAALAPLTAVRGNNDRGPWAAALPETATLELAGIKLQVIHDLAELRGTPLPGVAVVVSGHSHVPAIRERQGVLYVNPGSAGPRRFRLPICLGELTVDNGRATARLVELPV
jgi:putative phosphoesterase